MHGDRGCAARGRPLAGSAAEWIRAKVLAAAPGKGLARASTPLGAPRHYLVS
jgi:hypothetical protein